MTMDKSSDVVEEWFSYMHTLLWENSIAKGLGMNQKFSIY